MNTKEILSRQVCDDMCLEDLYITLGKISNHIVDDNKLYKNDEQYPLFTRKLQLDSLKALVKAIDKNLMSIDNICDRCIE